MKWKAVKLLDIWAVIDETGKLIYTGGVRKEAKLIAAAPIMLEFVKEMASRYEKSPWIADECEKILNSIK